MTADRLTEIKARVAQHRSSDDPYRAVGWMMDDLEYALGEIERLTNVAGTYQKQYIDCANERDRLQRERDLFFASVNEIGAERDRLRALCESLQNKWATRPLDHPSGEALMAENDRLRAALVSIAANTCCDRCQEAALVARAALREWLDGVLAKEDDK